jgi:hypothetical protein
MSKTGLHDPFGFVNISYGQKKGQELNWQFNSRALKVRIHHDFLACKWHDTYFWKDLDKGYNFSWNLISIKGLHSKLWASKVAKVLISRLQLGSPRTKWHLGVGHVVRQREYYKGEGGGFLQVRAVLSLVNPCLLVVRMCTKNAPTMH